MIIRIQETLGKKTNFEVFSGEAMVLRCYYQILHQWYLTRIRDQTSLLYVHAKFPGTVFLETLDLFSDFRNHLRLVKKLNGIQIVLRRLRKDGKEKQK